MFMAADIVVKAVMVGLAFATVAVLAMARRQPALAALAGHLEQLGQRGLGEGRGHLAGGRFVAGKAHAHEQVGIVGLGISFLGMTGKYDDHVAAIATGAKELSVKAERHQARQRTSVRRASPGTTDRRARRDGVMPSCIAV